MLSVPSSALMQRGTANEYRLAFEPQLALDLASD
jgi:hypothetical protein